MRKDHKDIIALLLLVVFNLLFTFIRVDQSLPPMEDAAMLMRYAENFSAGHGIVWNTGEKPVDGGTDFLAIIIIGMITKSGFSIESSVKLICILSHLIMVISVFLISRRFWNTSIITSLGVSLYLSVGPGLYYAGAYFTTSLFALFVLLAWFSAMNIMRDPDSQKHILLFPVFALVSGLIRPEGAILAVFMLIAVIYHNGFGHSAKMFKYFLLVFGAGGVAYFLWRWNYFGYPLPNPLYKKGGIYPGSLLLSVRNVLFMTLPFSAFYIYGLYSKQLRMTAVSYMIPVTAFTLMFAFISSQMNISGRFQYAMVPVVLVSFQPFFAALVKLADEKVKSLHGIKPRRYTVLAVIFFAGAVTYQYYDGNIKLHGDGNYEAGNLLQRYSDKGYTIATSEAGLIPFYSKWKAVDTWGLNDQWIAHNGKITDSYLDAIKPELISFHNIESADAQNEMLTDWTEMTKTLRSYAETHDYELAAVFGPGQGNSFFYYVKNSCPESRNIKEGIRSLDFIWFENGDKVENLIR
ncbi:MAG: hypothetical protein JNK43_03470 [Ignavibacteria bacterium]|nr:hypothetical protein [Ignavibacteria bacterium]